MVEVTADQIDEPGGEATLNLVLEGIAAVTLIGAGLGLFAIAQLESGMWSMNYGFQTER